MSACALQPGLALITGATGFVGANLLRLLLERGYEVRALIRGTSDRRNLPRHPALELRVGDLADASAVEDAARGCREIFHVAADYRYWARDPRELLESNVRGTENVLRAAAAAGVRRIVHTSTVGTIGLADQPEPCNETTPVLPDQFHGHYKATKLEAERIALRYAREGLPVVIVNPATPIGAWDRKPTPTGKIIVDFVNRRMPAYVDTGLCFVHARDVAEGHLLAAERGRVGERYILGGANLSIAGFLGKVAEQCAKLGLAAPATAPRIRIPYAAAWLTGALSTSFANRITGKPPAVPLEAVRLARRYMFFDSGKAIRELGLSLTPIEAAIRDALVWFRDNRFFAAERERNRDSYAGTG